LEEGQYPTSVNQLATAGYLANTTTDEQAQLTRIRRNYTYTRSTGTFAKK
jgi:hypothetical protein